MKLAVAVAQDFKDWEKFQSLLDSFREWNDLKWIVYSGPHPLIALYCKIDLVACGVNSFTESDKYDYGFVISTAKNPMLRECEALCYSNKPYLIYESHNDEFRFVHLEERKSA